MPGLTLWFSAEAPIGERLPAFRRAQRLMHHDDSYVGEVALAAGGLLVGHVGYPGYPIAAFEQNGFYVMLEGHVYNKDMGQLRDEIGDLASAVFQGGDGADRVRRWIDEADGDFLITVAEPKGEGVFVVADALGRLPVYLFRNGHELLIARECKFIAAARRSVEFDRVGWAQSLWIGYPLGGRTLFQDVERGGCGLFVHAAVAQNRLTVVTRELTTWDFGARPKQPRRVREVATDLVDLFGTAIRQRGEHELGRPRVVSLSGGHDSRSVAAGLRRFNGDYVAVSREIGGRSSRDCEQAEVIARELDVRWELIRVGEADAQAEARLVRLKDGMNYVGTAFMLEYLSAIIKAHGRRSVYITGDGGDKVFPDLRPVRRVANLDALVRELIDQHTSLQADVVEDMLGLERGTLEGSLRRCVAGYPEGDWVSKAVHFKISERSRKWLFEGEDRNRCFLWQSSPFYALPFFRYAMNVPTDLKRHFLLYREFQMVLWPTMAQIEHADTGFPIDSAGFRLKTRCQSEFAALSRPIKQLARRLVRRPTAGNQRVADSVIDRVRSQWRQSPELQSLIDERGLEAFLKIAKRSHYQRFWTLALLPTDWKTWVLST